MVHDPGSASLDLPGDWQVQMIRAYSVFGAADRFLDALTPDMRSMLAKRRRRDTREGHEGEFLEERNTFLPEPEVRADLDKEDADTQAFFESVDAEQKAWAEKGKYNRDDTFEEEMAKHDAVYTRGDFYTAIMLSRLGANEPPLVLGPEEFDEYQGQPLEVGQYSLQNPQRDENGNLRVREEDVFWRGLKSRGRKKKTMQEAVDGIAHAPADEYFVGQGIFGNGTYLGSRSAAEHAAGKPGDAETGTQLLGEDGNDGALMQFKLKPGTKLVQWSDIPKDIQQGPSDELAAWVILNGYHGIDGSRQKDWFGGINMLDRSQMVMERQTAPGEVVRKRGTPEKRLLAAMEDGDYSEVEKILAMIPNSPLRGVAEEALEEKDYDLLLRAIKKLQV